jgi:hypothetical protein
MSRGCILAACCAAPGVAILRTYSLPKTALLRPWEYWPQVASRRRPFDTDNTPSEAKTEDKIKGLGTKERTKPVYTIGCATHEKLHRAADVRKTA